MKAFKLRELIVLAKSGTHWDRHSQLSVYLVNNAEAIAELIEAAEEAAAMKIVEQWNLQEAIAKIKGQP